MLDGTGVTRFKETIVAESLYKRRVAEGLCGMCGKERIAPGSKGLCVVHQTAAKDKAAVKRKKQVTAGLCIESGCKEPPTRGGRCEKHNDYQKIKRQEANRRKVEDGICQASGCCEPARDKDVTLCQAHIDALSKTSSDHYHRRKKAELCRFGDHLPEPGQSLCAYHKQVATDYRIKVKLETMEAYGGAQCAICRESDIDMLNLDHIDTDGKKHREELGTPGGGHQFYLKLKSLGYPKTPRLRVLCANHNTKAYRELLRGRTIE